MSEEIWNNDQLIGIVVDSKKREFGIQFFTPNSNSFQLAYMRYCPGKIIDAHIHLGCKKIVCDIQETLFIKSGKIKISFYDNNGVHIIDKILGEGDVVLFISGGHGLEVLEEVEIIETKQGPYLPGSDKILIKDLNFSIPSK